MSTEAVKRKLAAILSADAVGYSRLMAHDEAATLKTLNAHRGLMGGLIRQHGGRVVDAVGDNLLAEFPSVVTRSESTAPSPSRDESSAYARQLLDRENLYESFADDTAKTVAALHQGRKRGVSRWEQST